MKKTRDTDTRQNYDSKVSKVRKIAPTSVEERNRQLAADSCRDAIRDILSDACAYPERDTAKRSDEILMAAYVLYRAAESRDPYVYDIDSDDSLDPDVLAAIKSTRIVSCIDRLRELLRSYPADTFRTVASQTETRDINSTPAGICLLAQELLDIRPGEKVIDLGCGRGTAAFDIKRNVPASDVYAVDVRPYDIAIARIINDITGSGISIECQDMFELAAQRRGGFDRVFSNYPFGTRIRNLQGGDDYLSALHTRIPSMSRATSSDWVFNALMADLLSDDGRAVGIMTNGSTWNLMDRQIREYFAENGLIECVIALPQRMFASTGIATSVIVMSRGNAGVRLVDASQICTPGRRINELSAADVDRIMSAVRKDSEISRFIDLDTLRANDYVLNLSRYTEADIEIADGRPFRDVIRSITRGVLLTADTLDEISSSEATDIRYLVTAGIRDGSVGDDLPYLKQIPKNDERYCVPDRALLISKNGTPYKIAVADIPEGQRVLASGNLYVIETDETQIDPYYLAAFLSSEQGAKALARITVGATIPNIGAAQLKDMTVPVPPLAEQAEIAETYRSSRDRIVRLQTELEEARQALAQAYSG